MYSFCPSELNVIFGINSCNLVSITLQLFPPVLQIRLLSDSSSIFNSIFGRSLSSDVSKKEYLLRGISHRTVAKSAFLIAKPLLYTQIYLDDDTLSIAIPIY